MLTRMIAAAVALAAPAIAAAVVDKLVDRMPEIVDAIADRVLEGLPDFSGLDEQLGAALASVPTIGEQVVRELRKSLPFGLGGRS